MGLEHDQPARDGQAAGGGAGAAVRGQGERSLIQAVATGRLPGCLRPAIDCSWRLTSVCTSWASFVVQRAGVVMVVVRTPGRASSDMHAAVALHFHPCTPAGLTCSSYHSRMQCMPSDPTPPPARQACSSAAQAAFHMGAHAKAGWWSSSSVQCKRSAVWGLVQAHARGRGRTVVNNYLLASNNTGLARTSPHTRHAFDHNTGHRTTTARSPA